MALITIGGLSSCEKKSESKNNEENEIVYYYVSGEKYFITQVKDKILILFTHINDEQLLSLISIDASLQPIPCFTSFGEDEFHRNRTAGLKTKNGRTISLSTIEYFKAREDVISVEYMYQSYGLTGISNKFIVKLKETTGTFLKKVCQYSSCSITIQNLKTIHADCPLKFVEI